MTDFNLLKFNFTAQDLAEIPPLDSRLQNWPTVYVLAGKRHIYVGETLKYKNRMRQHLQNPVKTKNLDTSYAIIDKMFNKSVALHLESILINAFYADGKFSVLNKNYGINDSNYYNRKYYESSFFEIINNFKKSGLLSQNLTEIINSDIYKYSPFKSLNDDQIVAVNHMLRYVLNGLEGEVQDNFVVEGSAGTGKTIVGIYFLKYLSSVGLPSPDDEIKSKDDFILPEFSRNSKEFQLLKELKLALVIPQESLRKSIGKIFKKTPDLQNVAVIDPFEMGKKYNSKHFDLVIVDEAHRLSIRANQNSGMRNRDFTEINKRLFDADSLHFTQLDWINHLSKNTVLMLDSRQNIRPMDLPDAKINNLINNASNSGNHYRLKSQMRMNAPEMYFDFIDQIFNGEKIENAYLGNYDLRIFDSPSEMQQKIFEKNKQYGLARMSAGYAYPWVSRNDENAYDIELEDGEKVWKGRWNSTTTDWINTPNSINEVGSIYTLQGYDLNYAGVIIGKDIQWDEAESKIVFVRNNYFDAKGKENNKKLGIIFSDEDLLAYVKNIYKVLLTRGIRGTFIYVEDEGLRKRFKYAFSKIQHSNADLADSPFTIQSDLN